MNSSSFALGNFSNGLSFLSAFALCLDFCRLVNGWPSGYAFILSFLAPLWTICTFIISVFFILNRWSVLTIATELFRFV